MTLLLVHHDAQNDAVVTFADSVVSNEAREVTQLFPKIAIINIRAYDRRHEGSYITSQDNSVCVAFAGSALTAQAIYTTASACLQNLASCNGAKISIEDACRLISRISAVHTNMLAGRLTQGHDRMFAMLVVSGHCPVKDRLCIYEIWSSIKEGRFSTHMAEISLRDAAKIGDTNVFGTGKAEFLKFAQDQNRQAREVFAKFIRDTELPTVGGYIQIGVADRRGSRIPPAIGLTRSAEDIVVVRHIAGIVLSNENLIENPKGDDCVLMGFDFGM